MPVIRMRIALAILTSIERPGPGLDRVSRRRHTARPQAMKKPTSPCQCSPVSRRSRYPFRGRSSRNDAVLRCPIEHPAAAGRHHIVWRCPARDQPLRRGPVQAIPWRSPGDGTILPYSTRRRFIQLPCANHALPGKSSGVIVGSVNLTIAAWEIIKFS
jgi:hypothetical protein